MILQVYSLLVCTCSHIFLKFLFFQESSNSLNILGGPKKWHIKGPRFHAAAATCISRVPPKSMHPEPPLESLHHPLTVSHHTHQATKAHVPVLLWSPTRLSCLTFMHRMCPRKPPSFTGVPRSLVAAAAAAGFTYVIHILISACCTLDKTYCSIPFSFIPSFLALL